MGFLGQSAHGIRYLGADVGWLTFMRGIVLASQIREKNYHIPGRLIRSQKKKFNQVVVSPNKKNSPAATQIKDGLCNTKWHHRQAVEIQAVELHHMGTACYLD